MAPRVEEPCLNAEIQDSAQDAEKLPLRFCHRLTVARFASFDDAKACPLLLIGLGKLACLRISERHPIAHAIARKVGAGDVLTPFIGKE